MQIQGAPAEEAQAQATRMTPARTDAGLLSGLGSGVALAVCAVTIRAAWVAALCVVGAEALGKALLVAWWLA